MFRSLVLDRFREPWTTNPLVTERMVDYGGDPTSSGPVTPHNDSLDRNYQQSVSLSIQNTYGWKNNPTYKARAHRGEIILSDNARHELFVWNQVPTEYTYSARHDRTGRAERFIEVVNGVPQYEYENFSLTTWTNGFGVLWDKFLYQISDEGDVPFSYYAQSMLSSPGGGDSSLFAFMKTLSRENAGAIDLLARDTLQRCYTKASEVDINVWVTLGEGKETVALIEQKINQLIGIAKRIPGIRKRALRALRLPNRKEAKAALDLVKNEWMALRYGVRPLVHDLQGLYNMTSAHRRPRMRFSSALTDTFHLPDRMYGKGAYYRYGDGGGKLIDQCRVTNIDQTITASSGLFIGPKNMIEELNSLFGAFDWLYAAWDLTMLSFVVDWFLNVSQAIQAGIAECRLTTLGSWTTISTMTRATIHSSASSFQLERPDETMANRFSMVDDWKQTSGNYTSKVTSTVQVKPGSVDVGLISKWRVSNPALRLGPSYRTRLSWAKVVDLAIILERVARRALK